VLSSSLELAARTSTLLLTRWQRCLDPPDLSSSTRLCAVNGDSGAGQCGSGLVVQRRAGRQRYVIGSFCCTLNSFVSKPLRVWLSGDGAFAVERHVVVTDVDESRTSSGRCTMSQSVGDGITQPVYTMPDTWRPLESAAACLVCC